MRGFRLSGARVALALGTLLFVSCAITRQEYEYEEDLYPNLDGSGVIYVNASVQALAALRGFSVEHGPRERIDRAEIRRMFTAPGVSVTHISTSRRRSRRFVHARLVFDSFAALERDPLFTRSRYRFVRHDGRIDFGQAVTGPASEAGGAGAAWTAGELIAVRVHLPSRVLEHNATAGPERGNILVWEQPLAARLAGRPLAIHASMETETILARTVMVFAMAFSLAMVFLAVVIVMFVRNGRHQKAA